MPSTSAMLSKLWLTVSGGRNALTSMSRPRMSWTSCAYSARLRRWNVRCPGFACACGAASSLLSRVVGNAWLAGCAGRSAGRRHHSRAQLAHHFLRDVSALIGLRGIEVLEHDRLRVIGVVTLQAEVFDHGAGFAVRRARGVRGHGTHPAGAASARGESRWSE
jgi:hypothetical protein